MSVSFDTEVIDIVVRVACGGCGEVSSFVLRAQDPTGVHSKLCECPICTTPIGIRAAVSLSQMRLKPEDE